MKKNQRFIAGATCPSCQAMDSILINLDDQSIECVDCQFTQTEAERDLEQQQKLKATPTINKTVPKKVSVSDIIRINELKD